MAITGENHGMSISGEIDGYKLYKYFQFMAIYFGEDDYQSLDGTG